MYKCMYVDNCKQSNICPDNCPCTAIPIQAKSQYILPAKDYNHITVGLILSYTIYQLSYLTSISMAS